MMLALRFLCFQIVCLTIDLAAGDGYGDYHYNGLYNPVTIRPVRTLPPDYVYHSDVKTAYKLHNDELNWDGASRACRSEGARLAVIDNPQKLQYVIGMKSYSDFVWTGIYRQSTESDWRAVDDVPLPSELPWSILSHQVFGECVAVHGWVRGLSSWSCDGQKKYVCEIADPA